MKVTLDLTELVAAGKLTPAEAERLRTLADRDAGALGANIILSFGVVAVVTAIGVLIPHAGTAVALGLVLMCVGFAVAVTRSEAWGILGRTCLVIGTLLTTGGLTYYIGTSAPSIGLLSLAVAAIAVFTRSGLLAALAVLGLGAAASSGLAWGGWALDNFSPRPLVTIVVFSALALGLLWGSTQLQSPCERLAIIAARTAVLVVNVAFLFASVAGDEGIPASVFAVVWAILLVVTAAWGVRVDRRWVVNTAALFGAAHFFVQWFLYLGANAVSVLGGGLLLIAFGFGLFLFNRRWQQKPA